MRLIERFSNPIALAADESQRAAADITEVFTTWDANFSRSSKSFISHAVEGYQGNGAVFALIAARMLFFSEATFIFENDQGERKRGRGLARLESPWTNGTTSDLLKRMELAVSLAGNSYIWGNSPTTLKWLRPDWVDLVVVDGELLGYVYWEGGRDSGKQGIIILPEAMAHYAPYPDPITPYKGESWISPVAREADADTLMSKHRMKFFEMAATPNMLIKVAGRLAPESRNTLRAEFDRKYGSWEQAYKTAILDGGADAQVVGSTFRQMSFEVVQSMGQTSLASAAGVPPIVVGFAKGLESSTYSNYGLAMRRFADLTMRPLWRDAIGALSTITNAPRGYRLAMNTDNIAALQQDAKDDAEIQGKMASTMRSLIDGGFTPDSVVAAVTGGDLTVLEHTGKLSVQLQDPEEPTDDETDAPVPVDSDAI